MHRILRYIIVLVLFSSIFSQDEENVDEVTKVGTAAANWLKLETNPRAIGMGGAFTSVGSGVLGIPYNPASVAFIKNQEGFVSKTNYVADISVFQVKVVRGNEIVGTGISALWARLGGGNNC